MKAATVFVQVALVAAGLLVYDQLRSDAPAPASDIDFEARAPAPREPAARPSDPIVLAGSGSEELVRRMAALEERLAALESRAASQPSTGMNGGSGRSDEPSYRPTRIDGPDPGTTEFSDEDVTWFRDVKKKVEEIERRERYVAMISKQLERLPVTLTAEQKDQVVQTTVKFRDLVRTTVEKHADKGGRTEARQTELDKLRADYDREIYRLVSTADAEKIVDVLGRYPGFGYRGGPGRPSFNPNR